MVTVERMNLKRLSTVGRAYLQRIAWLRVRLHAMLLSNRARLVTLAAHNQPCCGAMIMKLQTPVPHSVTQEQMAPHGVRPWPWQERTFMPATIGVCQCILGQSRLHQHQCHTVGIANKTQVKE